MTDDVDDYFETEIPLTPADDAQFVPIGRWLLIVGAVVTVSTLGRSVIRRPMMLLQLPALWAARIQNFQFRRRP